MLINIGYPDFFPTHVAKYYVGELTGDEELTAFLTSLVLARNPVRAWPIVGGVDYTKTAVNAGKEDIVKQINDYLRETKFNKDDIQAVADTGNNPFALVAAKRAGHEGTDRVEYLSNVAAGYREAVKFGMEVLDPFSIVHNFEPKTPNAGTVLLTRDERLTNAESWITAAWMWDYDTAIKSGFFTKKDPDTPADLAGAARQRRGVAWLVQCLNVYAHEVLHACEAPFIISMINFLKQEFIWEQLDVTVQDEIDRYLPEYKPQAPQVLDWGYYLPREVEGWNGKGTFLPTAGWSSAIKLYDEAELIRRPTAMALALAEYLQDYVTWMRNTNQSDTRSTVFSCFKFRSITTPHHLDVWGHNIEPVFTTGTTLSKTTSLYDFASSMVMPQTLFRDPPLWADQEIKAYVLTRENIDIDGFQPWVPVERGCRDATYDSKGSVRCYRSISYYSGGDGPVFNPGDVNRMALHFFEVTPTEFANQIVRDWADLVGTKSYKSNPDKKPPWYGIWAGITFQSKLHAGGTAPKSEEDVRDGTFTGAIYLAPEFAHPDAVAIVPATPDRGTDTFPKPFVQVTQIREGLRSGVSGGVRVPRTAYRIEPGLEGCTYSSSAMIESWFSGNDM